MAMAPEMPRPQPLRTLQKIMMGLLVPKRPKPAKPRVSRPMPAACIQRLPNLAIRKGVTNMMANWAMEMELAIQLYWPMSLKMYRE